MVDCIGLDLGYANISVSDTTLDVSREPSVAFMDKNTRRIVSVGREALTYDGSSGNLVRPFKNGLLYSADFTNEMIKVALSGIEDKADLRCVVGVPASFNSKQEKTLYSILEEQGLKHSFFVNRAVAAFVGAGYSPLVNAVSVNIGAASTEVAILYNGEIIYSATEKIGGEDFDEAVKEYILKQGELKISLVDARAIKESIGAVWEGRQSEPITISGTLALTGNTIKMTVSSEDILGVFEAPLYRLLSAIANGVKKIPTDCVEEIFTNGIILSGGGSKLYGLDKMITNVFNIRATVATNPEDCVARGLAAIGVRLPAKVKTYGKNITPKLSKHYKK